MANDPQRAVGLLDQRGEGLDPIARVQVADATDATVLCLMDMAADNTVTSPADGERAKMLLEVGDEADGGLDPPFDGLGEGEVFLAAPATPEVVDPVQAQEELVGNIAQDRQPAELSGHSVEGVTVDAEVTRAVGSDVHVLFGLKCNYMIKSEPIQTDIQAFLAFKLWNTSGLK